MSVLVLFMRMTMVVCDLVHHQAIVKLNCITTHADLFKFNKKKIIKPKCNNLNFYIKNTLFRYRFLNIKVNYYINL